MDNQTLQTTILLIVGMSASVFLVAIAMFFIELTGSIKRLNHLWDYGVEENVALLIDLAVDTVRNGLIIIELVMEDLAKWRLVSHKLRRYTEKELDEDLRKQREGGTKKSEEAIR